MRWPFFICCRNFGSSYCEAVKKSGQTIYQRIGRGKKKKIERASSPGVVATKPLNTDRQQSRLMGSIFYGANSRGGQWIPHALRAGIGKI
ncbi:hypothetical protein CEXT_431791 [Caerostris extrusa]|uniref:Uncharacterized protein n=1 Tax=Caerostris extrusa TaxID=172846 RepID=A0AAV4T0C9_CAEEX|nr:hypothetical protein CEXT_431791 [Caerostris extrusa]